MLNNNILQVREKKILDGIVPFGNEESRTAQENAQDAAVNRMFADLTLKMNSYGIKIRHKSTAVSRHHLVNLKASKQMANSQRASEERTVR